ncbi:contractile injection system tape measure protein [Hymenobacter elongatus]|uniref:Uncharacterized protein n=1 Tax=Hymenobacter elongatus TaxID=877208 RepID=A0A4Z0PGR4_9BACT|nr:contractile injection system tape measure protein [Hymenobacter elongatus]TGE14004.1 hypothetical protein E5J99_17955 [Hymenobacter elongatus]
MKATHAVQMLQLEVQADAASQAPQLPERLSALCQKLLPALLAEEFSAYCPADVHLQLPQLVLQLPPVADRRLEADLPDLLRQAIRTALAQLTAPLPAAGPSQKHSGLSELDILEYFLLHGRLPWHVNETIFSLRTMVDNLLTHHAAAFRALVVRLGRTPQVRQRLIWQLSTEQLERLIAILEPAHAPFLRDYLLTTLAAHQRRWLAPVTESALRSILYELILTDLLTRASSAFNRRAFVERQIQQLAARYNLSFVELLRQLADFNAPVAFATQAALPTLIRSLYQATAEAASPTVAAEFGRFSPGSPAETRGPLALPSLAVAGQSSVPGFSSVAPSPLLAAAYRAGANAVTGNPALERYHDMSNLQSATATATATATAQDGAAPSDVLAYFLRHGSLPAAHPLVSLAQLEAGLAAVLSRGWAVVRPLVQPAGAARTLARHFPEALLQQLLRLAAPGQVRPLLAVMESVEEAYRAAGAARPTRSVLWEHALCYFIEDRFRPLSSPAFRRWLTQQLPANAAREMKLGTASPQELLVPGSLGREWQVAAIRHYLVQGAGPRWWVRGRATREQLLALLAQVIHTNAQPLRQLLRERAADVPVLLRLARLTDLPLLATLLKSGSSAGAAHRRQLLAALEGILAPGGQARSAGQLAEFIRAAYLMFHLQARSGTEPLMAVRRLATACRLPWRAILQKAAILAQTQPALLAEPLFAALLAAHRATAFPVSEAQPDFSLPFDGRFPKPVLVALSAGAGSSPQFSHSLAGVATTGVATINTTATGSASVATITERKSTGAAAVSPEHYTSATADPATYQGAAWASREGKTWLRGLRRLPRPPAQLLALQPAAGMQELLFYYLRHGSEPAWWQPPTPVSSAWLGRVLRRVERQNPAAVRAFVQQHASTAPVRDRLAALADFTLLPRLLAHRPGRTYRATAALAALDRSEAGSRAAPASRWLLFLRAAYLAFHLQTRHQPATAPLREIQRLAAAHGLPWQALLDKIRRLLAKQPVLRTDAFFASLPPPSRPAQAGSKSSALPLAKSKPLPALAPPRRPLPPAMAFIAAMPPAARSDFGAATGFSPSSQGVTDTSGAPAERLEQLPTGAAARDLIFHLLLHQRPPWWAPASLTTAQSQQLLAQVAHYYRGELQALARAHGQKPRFRQTLVTLADFTLLARLTGPTTSSRPGSNSQATMAQLDRLVATAPSWSAAPVLLFLKEAFFALAARPDLSTVDKIVPEVRRRAAAAGISWRAVLQRVAGLQRAVPALAGLPFFAALLVAHVGQESARGRHRPLPASAPRIPAHLAAGFAPDAAHVFQLLEQYLHTGQLPTDTSANGLAGSRLPVSTATALVLPNARGATAEQRVGSMWKLLLQPANRPLLQNMRPLLALATVRGRLLASLAEKEFWRLLRHLYPAHYRLAAPVVADWQLLARQGVVRLSAPALFEVLLTLIQATPVASWRPDTLVKALLQAEEPYWPTATLARNQSRAGRIQQEAARRGLVLRSPLSALLTLRHEALMAAANTSPASDPIPFVSEEARPLETVYVANAGLVLLWPFLTMLFDRMGYLENQQFRDETAQHQAALLLQFLVAGTTEAPEYALPLNKLLCGIRQPRPLPSELHLTDAERELTESLLKAVIARWEILKNTSVAGLRETFLRRPGKLEWLEERIVLTVEPKTLDILLDQRPWAISIIKLPWMDAPLYVNWR